MPNTGLSALNDKAGFVLAAASWLYLLASLGHSYPILGIAMLLTLGLGGLVAAAFGGAACAHNLGRAKK